MTIKFVLTVRPSRAEFRHGLIKFCCVEIFLRQQDYIHRSLFIRQAQLILHDHDVLLIGLHQDLGSSTQGFVVIEHIEVVHKFNGAILINRRKRFGAGFNCAQFLGLALFILFNGVNNIFSQARHPIQELFSQNERKDVLVQREAHLLGRCVELSARTDSRTHESLSQGRFSKRESGHKRRFVRTCVTSPCHG